jgi:hypothetical protein
MKSQKGRECCEASPTQFTGQMLVEKKEKVENSNNDKNLRDKQTNEGTARKYRIIGLMPAE